MRMFVTLIVTALLVCFTTAAGAADKTGRDFLVKAIQGNNAEIELGQLASKKSSNADIKHYGTMLETDHSAANKAAKKVADAANITVSSEATAQQKATYDHLSTLSGKAFDDEFVKLMIKDHKKNVDLYEDESKRNDGDISQYARDTLPALRRHLDMAKSIKK